MLGVKRDNRDSLHGSRMSLGAEHWVGSNPNRMSLGAEHWVGSNPNPLRRVSQRKLARTNFDN